MFKFYLLSLLALGLSACSIMQRSENSGYAESEENPFQSVQEFYRAKAQQRWTQAQSDLGITQGFELAEDQVAAIKNRIQLSQLEQSLSYKAEKKQYYGYKPYFQSDAEGVYFLKLPSKEARERWAQQRGIASRATKIDPDTIRIIENNDVKKGMTKIAVEQSWGEPDAVEQAGDPVYGNERWKYKKLVSTQDGYQEQERILYFEAGRVAGWETRTP